MKDNFTLVIMGVYLIAMLGLHYMAFHYFFAQIKLNYWIIAAGLGLTIFVAFLMFVANLDIE